MRYQKNLRFLATAHLLFSAAANSHAEDTARLKLVLTRAAGLYITPHRVPGLNSTVLAISCNYAVRDLLLSWSCHAKRLGLKFLLLAMDRELAAWAEREQWV